MTKQIISPERKRADETLRRRTHELTVLYSIGHSASQTLELDEILNTSLDKVLEALEIEVGTIYLSDDSHTFRLHLHRGLSADFVREFSVIRDGGWGPHRAALKQNPVLLDMSRPLPEKMARIAEKEGLNSLAVVPLVAKDHILGELNLASRKPHAFVQDQIELLTSIGQQLGSAVENARLYEQSREQSRDLLLLHKVEQLLASSLEEETILREITSCCVEVFKVDSCLLRLIEGDGLVIKESYFLDPQDRQEVMKLLNEAPIHIGEGIAGRVAQTGEPLMSGEISLGQLTLPSYAEYLHHRHWLVVPMKSKGEVIGVLTLMTREFGRPFTERDSRLGAGVASQTAAAIELSRLFQETSRRAREAAAIAEVGRDISATLQLDLVLERIVSYAKELLGAETSAVHLYDSTDSKLHAVTALGKDAEELKDDPLELGKGIAGDIALKKKGEIVNYATSDPRAHHVKDTDENPLEHFMAVPILSGNKLTGLLVVWRSGANQEFRPPELTFLSGLAQQAAVAIENARLYEAQKRHTARLKAIGDVGRQIASVLDVGELLHQVVTSLVESFGYYYANILLVDSVAGEIVLKADAGQVTMSLGEYRLKIGWDGMTGWVAGTGQPLLANDVTREPHYKFVKALKDTQSELSVPIFRNKQVIGVLDVQSIKQYAFDDEDLFTLQALAEQTAIAIENARLYGDLRHLSIATIRSLATAIDARDPYTHGHSEGVTWLAIKLAQQLGWNKADLEMIEFAALLHDVGKIAVPDAVLKNTGPLTKEEWDYIHLHPYYGAQIVKPIELLGRIIPWIYHHHEHWDGSGYPDGLKGEDIPLGARIITVADAYNAMVTNRLYRKALSKIKALDEIERCSGSQFDPQIAKVLLEIIRD